MLAGELEVEFHALFLADLGSQFGDGPADEACGDFVGGLIGVDGGVGLDELSDEFTPYTSFFEPGLPLPVRLF